MNIINSPVTDDYSVEHTQKTRQELLDYLGIDGRLPKGFSLDHIKERSTCLTDDDFKTINYYTNLRLLPVSDNIARYENKSVNFIKFFSSLIINQNVVLPQAFFITTAPGNMTVTSLLN
jgi:hypothetical protein